ncbi:MAG: hypothetical protein LBF44_00060 [Holosporaceae bacterium]|jgi:hypothetical protein|nr:hypothetical protein [Holosporaceae bacterium]
MINQEKKDAQRRIGEEIKYVFPAVMREALDNLSQIRNREEIGMEELKAIYVGILSGIRLYSVGIKALADHTVFDKDLVEYTLGLRDQIDRGALELINFQANQIFNKMHTN